MRSAHGERSAGVKQFVSAVAPFFGGAIAVVLVRLDLNVAWYVLGMGLVNLAAIFRSVPHDDDGRLALNLIGTFVISAALGIAGIAKGGWGVPLGIAAIILWAIGFARVVRHEQLAHEQPTALRP
jgi:hypothetical protein